MILKVRSKRKKNEFGTQGIKMIEEERSKEQVDEQLKKTQEDKSNRQKRNA